VALNPAALLGAVGFLSRLPVGHTEAGWEAFRSSPATFPLAGYLVGALVALPPVIGSLLPVRVSTPTLAFAFVVGVYAVTGINHADGVADLGDAAVVHGDARRRREVLTDTTVGVGAVLAVALVVVGLATAGAVLAELARLAPVAALGVVVAAEVGAKAAMAALVCLGDAPHEGLGAALTSAAGPRSAVPVAVATAPAALLAWPRLLPGVAVLAAAALVAGAALWWARSRLGGVSGDVLGATNETARVLGLHVGVFAWTLS